MNGITKVRTGREAWAWLALVLAAVVIVGFSSAPAAQALPPGPPSNSLRSPGNGPAHNDALGEQFDEQLNLAMQYMRTNADESTYFDMTAAEEAGASAATLEVGSLINQLAVSQRGAGDDQMTTMLSVPIWGNWCGPGHGGGYAVDVLDSICQTHDNCYAARGYFACSCDRAIVADIRNNIYRMTTGERIMAAAVSTYFTYCLCNPFA